MKTGNQLAVTVLTVGVALLMCNVGLAVGEDEGKGEGVNEVTITKDQMPPSAQAAVDKEIAGKQVTNLRMTKETRDGKTVFDVKYNKPDSKVEIDIAEDGTVLNRDEETPITTDQMTLAAKAALDDSLVGKLVSTTNVRKTMHEGKLAYEVDFTEDLGQGMLWISEDGKILKQIGVGELSEPKGW